MHPPTIGPFQVLRELGRGGMGEVFLARDTRLDRLVAVKALPAHLAQDPDRLARFQREARVLASLNHPGIGAIYGVEESGGQQHLILEFIEGETLAERLAEGPVPVGEAVGFARQIAEALEAAHEKGVVHRDLKPGNVMVTAEGVVKVLDFGLARTAEGAPASAASLADSPTAVLPSPPHSPTIPGVILGTAGYMSPEQARGKPVDRRSDIFSFGCILFELLSGVRPFHGETPTDAIGAVLHREPDWSVLPAGVPPRVRELLASCLVKDRRNRLHDIGDARLAIDQAGLDPAAPTPRASSRREAAAWAVGVLAVCGAAAAWVWGPGATTGSAEGAVRFSITAPPGLEIGVEDVDSSISPDGRRVVFIVRNGAGPGRICVRELDDPVPRVLDGTEGAQLPFWSPDSRSIGFFAADGLLRIEAGGGPVQRVADAPAGRGGAWSETGVILFAPLANGPLHTVPQAGGTATPVLGLNEAEGETGHRFPQFLPGGRRFLYSSMGAGREVSQDRTFIASLGDAQGRPVVVAHGRATYADPGWLLFERSGMLYAQRFDAASGQLSGEAVATGIQPGGATNYGGSFSVSVSRNGVVACPVDAVVKTTIREFGADGKPTRTLAAPAAEHSTLRVSDNGERLVTTALSAGLHSEVRTVDLTRDGVWGRLAGENRAFSPIWSPDSGSVYYSSDRKTRDFFRWDVGGSGEAEPVLETGNLWAHPRHISPDGKTLVFNRMDPRNARDLWVLDLTTRTARALCSGPANEYDARFSPDGKLIALAIEELGRAEVYVQPFPGPGVRVRVSIDGLGALDSGQRGEAALRWSRDGTTLYFLDADRRTIRAAKITAEGGVILAARPEAVVQLPEGVEQVDIGPDARTFYGVVRAPGQASCAIAVTLHWPRLLSAR